MTRESGLRVIDKRLKPPRTVRRRRLATWRGGVACLLTLLLYPSTLLREAAAGPKAGQAIAEFEIAPDGDFIRLPVTVDEHKYQFLVSTGLTVSLIDDALRSQLALKKMAVEVRSKRSTQLRERYGGFYATLGNIPLEFP